jgi:hypothetical protein
MINATFDFLGLPFIIMVIAVQDPDTQKFCPAILIKTYGTLESSTVLILATSECHCSVNRV